VWEPTLERIFNLMLQGDGTVKIREAWAIECPNHGVSAQLNELVLQQPAFRHNFTCEKFAIAIHHFLSAGPDHGAKVDFRERNLVGIAHSLGGVSITILQNIEPVIKFSSIILVEPMLSPGGQDHVYLLRKSLVRSAYERRDVWPTREHALQSLKSKTRWHPRVAELFVKYALRPHPGSYADPPYNGFTLACTRYEEAAMYMDHDGPTKPVEDLNRVCARMSVHIIFGDVKDTLSREVHDAIIDPKSGRRFASISCINCGHLVPQQAPDKLGEFVFAALTSNATRPLPSRL